MSDVLSGIAIGAGFAVPVVLLYTAVERAKAYGRGYVEGIQDASGAAFALASVDTHPKDGDSTKIEAPLVSGAVPAGQTPNPSQEHRQPPVSE